MELARWRSLASASGVALGVKIGGVLRGVLPRSSALRASGGGARVFIHMICFCFPLVKYTWTRETASKEMGNMGKPVYTNVRVYKSIAMEAHREMHRHLIAGSAPKNDGSGGRIISFDREQRSLKQAMVVIAFTAMWLEALLHQLIVRHSGVEMFREMNYAPYEAKLNLLGCSTEDILVAASRLQTIRNEMLHEKAYLDNDAIRKAEEEADNAQWLMLAVEEHFMLQPLSGA